MARCKRLLCLCLALLVLTGTAAEAADTVYFTAVNDQLLPLNDESMPFWSGGSLYISYTAFENNELGLFYSRGRDKQTAVLYRQLNALFFDFTSNTIYDNGKQYYSGMAILRGDHVFLPLDVVCRYFGLTYSYIRIRYGALVRVKSESAVLSNATFIDAADALMSQRYTRYQRSKLPAEESGETASPTSPETAAEETKRSVCLAVEATDPARSELILGYFPSGTAAFLFAPEAIPACGGLLRRLASGAGSIALRVDASGGTEDALRAIRDGNRALWTAAACKTRLVFLDRAGDETLRAVEAAGYCPLRFAVNYGAGLPSVARASSRILYAASQGGTCRVFLGDDIHAAGSVNALLLSLRNSNCTPARLNELSAR